MTSSPPSPPRTPTALPDGSAPERSRQIRGAGVLASITSVILFASLLGVFTAYWETNDDVGMSMVAHGYGIASSSSSHLLFSNVLWGYLVRALPDLGWMRGYSIGSLAALMFATWGIGYFLLRLHLEYRVVGLAMVLLLARPILFPQFTINAGLLAVAAVLGWQVHARDGDRHSLIIASLSAFLGYLVRDIEFFFVLVVAAPLLPWRQIRSSVSLRIAFGLLLLLIVAAATVDHLAYQTPAWKAYQELNRARAPYTDFNAGSYIKSRPDVMARYGYSRNDIDLISDWFFVDPRIADPQSLTGMLTDAGFVRSSIRNWRSSLIAIRHLFAPALLPMVVCCLLLLAMRPSWTAGAAWLVFLAALGAMGALGRPGLSRVDLPVIGLLLLEVLVSRRDLLRERLPLAFLSIACLANLLILLPQSVSAADKAQRAQRELRSLPAESLVVWGAALPYESLYPPYGPAANGDLRIYGLGTSTKAPFSEATAEEAAGSGMLQRLLSPAGIPIVLTSDSLELLRTYCVEHDSRQLKIIDVDQGSVFTARRIRCE